MLANDGLRVLQHIYRKSGPSTGLPPRPRKCRVLKSSRCSIHHPECSKAGAADGLSHLSPFPAVWWLLVLATGAATAWSDVLKGRPRIGVAGTGSDTLILSTNTAGVTISSPINNASGPGQHSVTFGGPGNIQVNATVTASSSGGFFFNGPGMVTLNASQSVTSQGITVGGGTVRMGPNFTMGSSRPWKIASGAAVEEVRPDPVEPIRLGQEAEDLQHAGDRVVTGHELALDRDDLMVQDWKKLDFAIGICGGGNFSGSNDCTPMGCTKTVERDGKVDFLVIRAKFMFWCATT